MGFILLERCKECPGPASGECSWDKTATNILNEMHTNRMIRDNKLERIPKFKCIVTIFRNNRGAEIICPNGAIGMVFLDKGK